MRRLSLWALVALVAAVCAALPVLGGSYAGHSVYEFSIPAERFVQSGLRQQLLDDADIWREAPSATPGHMEVHVRLTPAQQATLLPQIVQAGAAFVKVLEQDLQRTVDAEFVRLQAAAAAGAAWNASQAGALDTFFDDFRPIDAHRTMLSQLAAQYPELIKTRVIGRSNEGQDIVLATVTAPSDASRRAGILVQAGTHAREWLATPQCLYMIKALAEGHHRGDAQIVKLMQAYNWFFVALVNPDGYRHSWASSSTRLWRKNRRANHDGSFGVDLNRNYDGSPFCSAGSSRTPSSDTYCGTGPASEPEVAAVSQFIRQNPSIKAAFDIHTYSRLLLYPWQYTYDKLPAGDLAEYRKQGAEMARVIRSLYGQVYDPIQGSDLYPHSGGMIDYAWATNRAWAYTFEGRGNSFIIDRSNIKPACEEQTQAIFWLAGHILGL